MMLKKLKQKIILRLFLTRFKQFLRKQRRLYQKCERCSITRRFCLSHPEYYHGPYDDWQ